MQDAADVIDRKLTAYAAMDEPEWRKCLNCTRLTVAPLCQRCIDYLETGVQQITDYAIRTGIGWFGMWHRRRRYELMLDTYNVWRKHAETETAEEAQAETEATQEAVVPVTGQAEAVA